MKSTAASPPIVFLIMRLLRVRIHSGPAPSISSTFFDKLHGFLKRRSVTHSVEDRLKVGVTPSSSSSQFSIGVISTAAVGLMDAPDPVKLTLGAPPISTIATPSLGLGD